MKYRLLFVLIYCLPGFFLKITSTGSGNAQAGVSTAVMFTTAGAAALVLAVALQKQSLPSVKHLPLLAALVAAGILAAAYYMNIVFGGMAVAELLDAFFTDGRRQPLGSFWAVAVRYGGLVPIAWGFQFGLLKDTRLVGLNVLYGFLAGLSLFAIGWLAVKLAESKHGGPTLAAVLLLMTPLCAYVVSQLSGFDDVLKSLSPVELAPVFGLILAGLYICNTSGKPVVGHDEDSVSIAKDGVGTDATME